MQVEENERVVGAGGREGVIMDCLALGLEGREISFDGEREEEVPVERKRPSSSSKGAGGMMDLAVVSGDLVGWESKPKWFLRDFVDEVDERRNKSSGWMGWASRSESPSKSESGGTKDFLRRGDGVSAGELYLRKWREEGISGEEGWLVEKEKRVRSYHILAPRTETTPSSLSWKSLIRGNFVNHHNHVIASKSSRDTQCLFFAGHSQPMSV